MSRPPDQEPEDPGANTEMFRAFVKGEETESARAGAPRFPAGVLALLVLVGIVVVVAIVLLRA